LHLIEPAELAARFAVPETPTVVFDCRHDLLRPEWGRQEFAAAHIPGAVFAHLDHDLSSSVTPQSGRHPLPVPAALAAFLGAAGVDADTEVVAYDQDKSPFAARLWWLLRWLGHERVSVLNGGLAAWRAADLPLQSAVAPRVARPFIVRPAPVQAVTTAEVQRELEGGRLLLLDARSADRFAGQNETIDPVAGHVPGARNQPFALNLDSSGRLRSAAALRAQWRAALGDTPPTQVVAMCGSGVTACHNLLAMELAGLPGARLYAGSFSEWIRDPARKVATGPV
jgi:thiosulfate/3-mercaptopyruvate sulfurtransferase